MKRSSSGTALNDKTKRQKKTLETEEKEEEGPWTTLFFDMWGEIFIASVIDNDSPGDWSLFMVGQTCKTLYNHARTFYRQQLCVASLTKVEEQAFLTMIAVNGMLQWPLATLEEWIFGPAYFSLFAPVEEPNVRQLRIVFLGKVLQNRDDFQQLLDSPDKLQSILKRLQKEFKTNARCICCDDEHQPKFRMRAFVKPMLKYAVRHDNVEALCILWPFAHFYSNHQTLVQGTKYKALRGKPRQLILRLLACETPASIHDFINNGGFRLGFYEKLVTDALEHSSIGALGFFCEKRPHDGWAVGLFILLHIWNEGIAPDSDTRPALNFLLSQWPASSVIGDKFVFLTKFGVAAFKRLQLNRLPEQRLLIDASLAEFDIVHSEHPDFLPGLRETLLNTRDELSRIQEERETVAKLVAFFNTMV